MWETALSPMGKLLSGGRHGRSPPALTRLANAASRLLTIARSHSPRPEWHVTLPGAPCISRVSGIYQLPYQRSQRPCGPEIVRIVFTQSEVEQFIARLV